ncbi:type II secretion system protein N [Aquabacterium humicola]|uniref:type II secretion system protein N n=1 Tax=Aquabacterium humicola TaxID=3237377 RepID=UPI0025434260|nr:type II secretion system protein N [Rubrivivax pictus]
MSSRVFAFVIWAAVAASALFWGFRLLAKPLPVPAQAAQAGAATPPVAGDLARLFGPPAEAAIAEVAPPPAIESRFKLVGVVAPAAGHRNGLALIAVDGGAPKPVALGGRVDAEWTVAAIGHRRVELAPAGGQPRVALELPALPDAARGDLPRAGAAAPGATPPPPAPLPYGAAAPMPAPQPMGRPRPTQRTAAPFGVVPNPGAQAMPQASPLPFGVTPPAAAVQAPMAPSEPVNATR